MALKPENSIMASLAVGAVVYGIHANATPNAADIRSLDRGNVDIQKAERTATWLSAGVVAGISLIAKDPTIFVIGGAMTIALAWWTRHADAVDTVTKSARDLLPTRIQDVGNTPADLTAAPAVTRTQLNLGASVI